MNTKHLIDILNAWVGSIIFALFGAKSVPLQILIILMIMDYLSGILAAALFHNSKKTASGALSSKAGFIGLLKKFFMLLIVSLAHFVDMLLNVNGLLFTAVVLFYCSNEAISILENAIALNVPVPEKLKKAIESLTEDK